jgi:hypothetical protein
MHRGLLRGFFERRDVSCRWLLGGRWRCDGLGGLLRRGIRLFKKAFKFFLGVARGAGKNKSRDKRENQDYHRHRVIGDFHDIAVGHVEKQEQEQPQPHQRRNDGEKPVNLGFHQVFFGFKFIDDPVLPVVAGILNYTTTKTMNTNAGGTRFYA